MASGSISDNDYPKVHVAICGLEKLVPGLHDALRIIKVLPRNATGQAITSYVTWITGRNECEAASDGFKEYHIVFLDNGRTALAKDPVCGQALRCVRCGACANVCPVYRLVGGHKMGHIYIGAIGLILTYFFHGHETAKNLVQNCINCEACKNVCAAGIDLPGVIQEIRSRLNEENGAPLSSSLLASVLKNRKLFHTLLRFGKWAQKPVTGGSRFVRHLPDIFAAGQGFRALPAIADEAFRDQWPRLAPTANKGEIKVGLFSGCAQDFIYPEQLKAAVGLMGPKGCRVAFPLDQSCCGLPVQMMGDREAARATARQNVLAFAAADCDHIVTLCASCASHLKHRYPEILADDPQTKDIVQAFCDKVIDFSSFAVTVLGLGEKDFANDGEKVCYHASCHLCRGLGVTQEPRSLMAAAGEYVPTPEEDVCCGFGGTYSVKFPEISGRLMEHKLAGLEDSGASTLLTDCPGCVMQLKGGEEKRGRKLKVEHMAEFLARKYKGTSKK
ncbi:LUD domain-containing protein [Deltaproteobacteria bacterium OttesenSCG-928-K17]|nr:LUD domain-containing protein [Deltaproteobacteria bacterium OttesenSCG-928-K17]